MIEFSDHSRERNRLRKIPRNRIIQTVKNPDLTLKSYRNREIRRKKFAGKILEVVTVTEVNRIIIHTQYYIKEKNGS